MGLPEVVYARCTAHVGTAALIGTRCYPNVLPENVVYPAIRFLRVSDDNAAYRDHDGGPTPRSVARVQFDCIAETHDDAADVADQLYQAWDGYKDGCTVGRAHVVSRLGVREVNVNRHRDTVDVVIDYAV